MADRHRLGVHCEVTLEEADVENGAISHDEDGLKMRVNIYAEETTPLVEIIEKTNESGTFTGLRFWLHLPATMPDGTQFKGPFMHHKDDDDSSAVTFWGKHDMRANFQEALRLLDAHYEEVSLRHPPRPDQGMDQPLHGHSGPDVA